MKGKDIERELKELGYDVRLKQVEKDGEKVDAIIFDNGTNICPTICNVEGRFDRPDIIKEMCAIFDDDKKNPRDFKDFMNRESIEKNIFMVLLPKRDDDHVKRDYLDLQLKLRLSVIDNAHFVTIKEDTWPIFEKAGFESWDELWDLAERNTEKKLDQNTVLDLAGDILNIDADEVDEIKEMLSQIEWKQRILTVEGGRFGAVAMFYTDRIKAICQEWNENGLWIIPSSIHEIMVSDPEGMTGAKLNKIIYDTNRETVDEKERLADHGYYYSLAENKIIY